MLSTAVADEFDQAADLILQNARQGASSQQKIDDIDDAGRQALFEYRALLKQNDSLKLYVNQLRMLVEDQQGEIVRKESEMIRVKRFEREIMPLLGNMVDELEQLLVRDVPFLPEERQQRVQKLRQMMSRSDVNIAEKFRRVFEAYQIEADYGRNIETYQGSIALDSKESRTVNFLRVGRNVLIYQTLDETERAVWNHEASRWQAIPDGYADMIRKAVRIARKHAAPDLLILPVSAPQSSAPQSSAPPSSAPQPSALQSSVPQPSAPQSPAPQSSAPPSSAPQPSAPQSSAPQSSAPQSSAPPPFEQKQ